MKYNIKSVAATALAILMASATASAQLTNGSTVNYDGLYYKVTYTAASGTKAEVKYATLNPECSYDFNYKDIAGEVNIPANIVVNGIDVPVAAIAASSFANAKNITKVTVPNTVTSVGNSAFQNAASLAEVIFEPGAASMSFGTYMFQNCAALKRVVMPDALASWTATGTFSGCESLKSVVFPESSKLTSISGGGSTATGAFYNCKLLKSFAIPAGVTSISTGYLFEGSGIKNITFPAALVTLSGSSMFNNSDIETVTFTENTEVVNPAKDTTWLSITGASTFADTPKLNTVIFPTYLKTISGASAFANTPSLKNIFFPENCVVNSLGANFAENSGIVSFTVPKSVTTIGIKAFLNCANLTDIKLHGGLTVLEINLFQGCKSLKSVVIPEGVTTVGAYIFYDCPALESVVFPSTMTSCGKSGSYTYAIFNTNNTSMKAIVACAAAPSSFASGNTNLPNYATIPVYVPSQAAVTAYKAKTYWKNFNNFQVAGELTLPESITLYLNETRASGAATVNNVTDVEEQAILWSSSAPATVSVDAAGNLTALDLTAAPVTVTGSFWGLKMTTQVSVIANPFMITAADLTMNVGTTQKPNAFLSLNSSASPTLTLDTNPVYDWTFSKEGIVKVNESGSFTALSYGVTKATANYRGATATINVAVIPEGDLQLDAEATINAGQLVQLNPALIFGDNSQTFNASDVKWSSDMDPIAFVGSDGKVYGVREGTATITANYFGKTATCLVTVIPGVAVDADTYTLVVHMPDAHGAIHILNATDGTLVEFEPYYEDGLRSVHHDDMEVTHKLENKRYTISKPADSNKSTLKVHY